MPQHAPLPTGSGVKRKVAGSEVVTEGTSAMERFHATFQAALTQELGALVRDLQTASGSVAAPAVSLGSKNDGTPQAEGGAPNGGLTRAMVHELVARWGFVRATYQAHVAAEDAVVLPALDARVNNVAHAYELEHEAEDELFDGKEANRPSKETRRMMM